MPPTSPDSPSTSAVANPGLIRPPRVFLTSIVIGLIGHVLWPDHFVPAAIGIPVGVVLLIVAVALFVRASRAFKAAGTPVPGNQPATAIVRDGPYRVSRNPIYLAFVLFQLGIALLANSLSLVITVVPALCLMAWVVIPREERYLTERFPVEYGRYRASTRRWL